MAKWPLLGPVLLSPREEQARVDRLTTDVTLRQDLEDSARERGLRYCDECGQWFQAGCYCVLSRDE